MEHVLASLYQPIPARRTGTVSPGELVVSVDKADSAGGMFPVLVSDVHARMLDIYQRPFRL
jgi:hypothetical protein